MCESAQIALPDNTMAADKNRKRIVSAGRTDCARRAVERIGDLTVRYGVTGSNLSDFLPHPTTKFRAVFTGLPAIQDMDIAF